MYEQLDGILTCPDLSCASCVKFRQPWVPLHTAPKRPRYLNLSLVYLNLGPPDRSLVPRDVQEASRVDFGFWSDFGPFREALEATKHCKFNVFYCISCSATDIVQIVQISPWEVPDHPEEAPRSGPGRPRTGSRGFKTAPRAAGSAPRAPPKPPKHGLRAALAPSWAQKSRPEASRRPFWTPRRGPVLYPPGVDVRTVFFFRKA